MLIDLEKGRPMELEVVVGYVIEKAKELKVDVPVSSVSLYSLIVKQSLRPVSGRDSS
jgi:ketopantoate reductase